MAKIARDLHDSTGQNLAGLVMMLGQLRDSIPPDKEKSTRLLSECKLLANRCIREIRTLSYLLHPPNLEQVGLIEANRGHIKGFSQRSHRIWNGWGGLSS